MEEIQYETEIYEIDINGCVQNWVFARNQFDALAVMVECQGEWLDEIEDQITITHITQEKASDISIRSEDHGVLTLWNLYRKNPKRSLVASTEW